MNTVNSIIAGLQAEIDAYAADITRLRRSPVSDDDAHDVATLDAVVDELTSVVEKLKSLAPPDHYYIADDADDEPTLWRDTNTLPHAVITRWENEELWDAAVAGRFPERDS